MSKESINIAEMLIFCEVIQFGWGKLDLGSERDSVRYPKLKEWMDSVWKIEEVKKVHRFIIEKPPKNTSKIWLYQKL